MAKQRKFPEGMHRRKGRRGYYAEFVVGGRRVQKKLANDFEAARKILHDLRARAEKGEYGLLDNDYLIDDLKGAYLKRCSQELRPNTLLRYGYSLKAIMPALAVRKVSQVTVEKVLAYREERLRKGVSPRTVNHDVTILSAMFGWGVDKNIIGSNPLRKMEPLLHDHPKEGRALTDAEVEQLLKRSPMHWRTIWYALLVTGMRKDELANLRFTDIDWESRELIVRAGHAKSRRERRIPIEEGLYAILEQKAAESAARQPGTGRTPEITMKIHERFTRQHVFVTTQNTPLAHRSGLYNAFMRCGSLAKIQTKTYDGSGRLIEHVDLHSLRRTMATNAITNGADPKSVQEIVGHSTLEMTMKIYTKIKGISKRQAIGKLSYGTGATLPAHVLPLDATKRPGASLPPSLPIANTGQTG